jgi:G2/mitotic-specific cyclin 2
MSDRQTPNLEHFMTYSEEELLPTANIMVNYILEPIPHESLYKKYAHKRYLKVPGIPCSHL